MLTSIVQYAYMAQKVRLIFSEEEIQQAFYRVVVLNKTDDQIRKMYGTVLKNERQHGPKTFEKWMRGFVEGVIDSNEN